MFMKGERGRWDVISCPAAAAAAVVVTLVAVAAVVVVPVVAVGYVMVVVGGSGFGCDVPDAAAAAVL